jgi:hypothetical protein
MCDVVCCGKGEVAMYGLVAAGWLQCMRWCVYAVNASVSSQQVSPSGRRRQTTRLQKYNVHLYKRDENGPTRYGAATRAYRWYFINHDLPSVK